VAALGLIGPGTLLSQARQRSLWVSVVDRSGAPVLNLQPSDLAVREDDRAREILRVSPADEPMQIAVLVDNSQAAQPVIADIRRALGPFVEALTAPSSSGTRHTVALITLAERPRILADYTSDRTELAKAIALVWSNSQVGNAAYLLDAILEVTKGFTIREAARPVIVAIMSEGPELSWRDARPVLAALTETSAAFHVVGIGIPSGDISEEARNRNIVVEDGPRLTGGLRDQLLTGLALPAKLLQIADVLTHQYRVTYAQPDQLVPPERMVVSARRADLVARGTPIKEARGRR